ncbi:OmpA family protein [Actinocorallia populi]|uniref:OmpA family protein n=1 Tax=Actinocorallia populi TaxID=2079200 RepID=UPI000D08775E|nr:OmpA family protein [Actinocorallia populi]
MRVLPIAALLVLAVGCSSTEDPPAAPPPRDGAPPASSGPSGPAGPRALASVDVDTRVKARLEVVGLNRHGGDHVLAQIRVTNNDTVDFDPLNHLADDTDATPDMDRAGGIFLLDAAARRVVKPLQGEDGCVCSVAESSLSSFLKPGEHETFFAVLPAPSGGARTATLLTPMSPPLPNIPISDAPPSGQGFPEPVGEVVSYPVDAHSEDDDSELRDDGEEVEVSLSADVLFATGSHALTAAAGDLIERTAGRIPGGAVKVEGHADSTGTAAVNTPLSRRRADAVAARLKSLLPGAAFTTEGFGSSRPLYPNTTPEGRRRNRRVTITFTRAEKPEPRPATTAPAAPAAPRDGFTLTVDPLVQVGGGLSLLTYALTNTGQSQVSLRRLTDDTERTWLKFRFWAAANAKLVDGDRRIPPARYLLGTPTQGWAQLCLCTKTSGIALGADRFAPAQTKHFWALVQTPSGPVTAEIADLPAAPVPQ